MLWHGNASKPQNKPLIHFNLIQLSFERLLPFPQSTAQCATLAISSVDRSRRSPGHRRVGTDQRTSRDRSLALGLVSTGSVWPNLFLRWLMPQCLLDPLSYTAPSRLRVLLLPLRPIKKARFSLLCDIIRSANVVRLDDVAVGAAAESSP